ncbi:MAG: hypothetical protein L6Q71_11595, partial [Planctomycetes bacterium]|nr:hypothetical protein [Planctomycetota bacterium]
RSTVEFKQPALVAFEYSTHVKRIGKTSATTYDVDYERVPLRDVIELGQRFGVTVEADAPVAAQADRVFIDLKSDSLDRDGYIQALEKKIPSIGLALRNTTAGVYRLIDHSTGHRDDLAWEPHRLNVVVRSGSARVGTTRLAQRASSGVQQVIVGRSEQAPRNPTPSEAKVILSNVVLNADVRFDVPLSDGSAGMTAALSRDIGALQIIRHVFPVDSAIADINGKDVWIKANNGMKLYEVGKSATFGKTSGKLLSANDRGALIETDGGQTVHVSFQ